MFNKITKGFSTKRAKLQVVDFAQNEHTQVNNLEKAFSDGCFFIRNHSMIPTIKKVRQQMDNFYKLNLSDKNTVGQISGKGATRGYFPIGAESGSVNLIEKKESFSFGHKDIPEDFISESNLVAKNLYHQSFNCQDLQTFIEQMAQTSQYIVNLLYKILNFENIIIDKTSQYQSFIRSFRYYPIEDHDQLNTTANSLHSDWNLLTLVWGSCEGLQLERENGEFEDVFGEENDLIVNYGDYLCSLTNGKTVSPWHRVIPPTKEQKFRDSFVYFYYPSAYANPALEPQYVNNKLLGLFINQSTNKNEIWQPQNVKNMGELYALKWKQVGRSY